MPRKGRGRSLKSGNQSGKGSKGTMHRALTVGINNVKGQFRGAALSYHLRYDEFITRWISRKDAL